MMKTNNKQDASERRWVITLLCHIKRLAFANEVKTINGLDPVLDGGDIKIYAVMQIAILKVMVVM